MDDQVEHIPITTEEAVEAVLNGAWLYRADIPDIRALVEGVQMRSPGEDVSHSNRGVHCYWSRIAKSACSDLSVRVPIDFSNSVFDDVSESGPLKTVPDDGARGIDFSGAQFAGYADFTGVTFTLGCDFSGAQFAVGTRFLGAVFKSEADFGHTGFGRGCDFGSCQFSAAARFLGAEFAHDVAFIDAKFAQQALFGKAAFSGPASFDSVTFSGVAMFPLVAFQQRVSFARANVCTAMTFFMSRISGGLDLDGIRFELGSRVSFQDIDLRPGGKIELTIDQIGRRGKKLIEGEDSKEKEKLKSAAAQYNMLRDNFRTLPSTDEEEDRCHYKYMDLRRRASDWRWPKRFADWFFLKWCWGYGIYTHRTIISILLVILGFGLIYYASAGPETIRNYYMTPIGLDAEATPVTTERETNFNPWYFSIITFTTIGYGDYAPLGWLRWVAGLEGLTGLFLMAVFTVSFARKFIR
ncbi:MAG: pentapeptide repeat-containing protein [Phycisphaerae bacterium]|jgi:uncharacterized protein YjbI with pentapeptide repeats